MVNSKRAQLLSEVLEYFNRGDWEHHGDFLVFGKDAFESHISQMTGEGTTETSEHEETINSLGALGVKLKIGHGEREIAKRTTLSTLPSDPSIAEIVSWASRLPEKERLFVEGALQKSLQSGKHATPVMAVADAIDAALASAAVRGLDDAAGRISTFDVIGPFQTGLSGPRSAEYFEEAHGCDLAGLRIASAVLCRAMLEAALIERIDPKGKMKQKLEYGESYIGMMIQEAAKLHLLDSERAKCAVEIRDAGNDAIHDLGAFKKKYALRMRCIVDNLRKVLIDIYED